MSSDGTFLRLVVGLIGGFAFVVGVLAVFLTSNAGSAALVTLGALALVAAVFSERIESLDFGGPKLKLRDLARQRFALASERDEQGNVEDASRLRKQARALQRLSGTYRQIRRSMAGGPERTPILDDMLRQARELAAESKFDPAEVWRWYDDGAEEARIIALGLMDGDERLRDFFCALDAIENSRSAFEQYYGLRVARKMIPGLSPLERDWLKGVVAEARRSKQFGQDTARMQQATLIDAELSGNRPDA